MKKNFTIKQPRKVGGNGQSMTTAGAVGLGALILFFGGLVLLGNTILNCCKKAKQKKV